MNKIIEDELKYSLIMIESQEKHLQEQKDILLNFDFEKPLTLETWRQLFLTPLGTFPKSLTELLRNSLSKDIKNIFYISRVNCRFLWKDIEISFPATYGRNTPIIYIDTNWFYQSEVPYEKTDYLVNTILPKLKEFGCEDIRQWGIKDPKNMNDKNMDNIIQYMNKYMNEETIEKNAERDDL